MNRKRPAELSPASSDALPSAQQTFLSQIQVGLFPKVFAALENVLFFLKDRAGHFIVITRGARFHSAAGTLPGCTLPDVCTDHDLYPRSIADRIRANDQLVMRTGKPLLNVVELLVNPRRCAIGWHTTNKFPVLDLQGQVIGVMGTVQPCEDRFCELLKGTRLDHVVESIRSNPTANHSVAELARLAGMSPRNMGRYFQQVLGMSPRDFRMLCRIKIACERLVYTQHSVGDIAQECGFCDQSAFAYHFRKAMGTSPLAYRDIYRQALAAHPSP